LAGPPAQKHQQWPKYGPANSRRDCIFISQAAGKQNAQSCRKKTYVFKLIAGQKKRVVAKHFFEAIATVNADIRHLRAYRIAKSTKLELDLKPGATANPTYANRPPYNASAVSALNEEQTELKVNA
jgi:hypothetical protein